MNTHVVYTQTHNINNRLYIGITNNFNRRMAQHKLTPNKKMKADIVDNDYYATYKRTIVFEGTEQECSDKEIELIDSLEPYYNTLRGGYGYVGHTGENSPTGILTNKEAYEIRMLFAYADDYNQKILGEIYEVAPSTIASITRGEVYTDAGGPIINIGNAVAPYASKVSDKDVLEIRERAYKGETDTSISKDFPLDRRQIGRIVCGKRRKNLGGKIRGIDYSGKYKNTPYTEDEIEAWRYEAYMTTTKYSVMSHGKPLDAVALSKMVRGITYKEARGLILGKDYQKRGEGNGDK